MEINEVITNAYSNAEEHGFYDDIDTLQATRGLTGQEYSMLMNNAINTRLMLIVGEVAEAMEAIRKDDDNFREELADVAIRLFDLCGFMAIDLENEIEKKMKINADRPYKHGKAF